VFTEGGRFKDALENFDRALELAAGDAALISSSRNGQGTAYAALGNYARAFEEFQASLELTPGNAWAASEA
jgi:tetratricopeptide (TPR) repeat protein